MIAEWMFPDQDLLGYIFPNWTVIPWYYNAIKTFRYWHGSFYTDEQVRNLHYIVDKPWRRRPNLNSLEDRNRSGLVYRVEAGDYKDVKDDAEGVVPGKEGDAVTHGWWWEEYEEMVSELRGKQWTWLDYVEDLVAT